MVAPDVQIEDGKGTILISSEEGETEGERRSHPDDINQLVIVTSTTTSSKLFYYAVESCGNGYSKVQTEEL